MDGDLVLDGHGHVLALLQQLSQPHTPGVESEEHDNDERRGEEEEDVGPVEQLLGGGVEVGAELGEGGDLTVLGQLQLHGTSDLRGEEERRGDEEKR